MLTKTVNTQWPLGMLYHGLSNSKYTMASWCVITGFE